jgi:hypothetical protein
VSCIEKEEASRAMNEYTLRIKGDDVQVEWKERVDEDGNPWRSTL